MKKALAFLLVVLMISTSACGNAKPDPTPAASTSSGGTETTAPQPAGEKTAADLKPSGYPNGGTVTVVCGFSAGGAADNACRVVAQYAGILSKDNYIVTNITGASGRTAATDVSNSKADGLKIVMENLVVCDPENYSYLDDKETLESLLSMSILMEEEFTPVAAMIDEARSFTIRANDERFSNWEEFKAYALAHPGELTLGDSGANGSGGLMMTLFIKKLGLDVNVVHYTSTSELHPALLGGHIDGEMAAISAASTDGDLAKTIAVASEQRVDLFPDIPTFKESGDDLVITTMRTFFVKKGTDEATVNYLSALFGEVAADAKFQDDCKNVYSASVSYVPHAEMQANLDATYQTCMELLK